MKLLGFYLGLHDSNLAFYDGEVHYLKSERIMQVKHHKAERSWIDEVCAQKGFVPDVIAFSDGNRNELGICDQGSFVKEINNFRINGKRVPAYCLDHHYAHTLSAWPVCPVKIADYGISLDGRGDHGIRISVIKYPGSRSPEFVYQSEHHAFCRFFNLIGQRMNLGGLELDFAGKIMGAHAYGQLDPGFIEANCTPQMSLNPLELFDKICWQGLPPDEWQNFYSIHSTQFRNWLASVHALIGKQIISLFRQFIPTEARVIYTGGAAQNTVYNQELKNIYQNLFIPPHCYDGGISLGCIEYLRMKFEMDEFSNEGFPFWQDGEDGGYAGKNAIHKVAEHLSRGKIVGWFQGRGEVGPRALGHRSILFNPTLDNGKDYINKEIKKREFWRPFAPSILRSAVHKIATDADPSPFMVRAIPIKKEVIKNIPAVVHVDGTSRLQTIDQDLPALTSYCELLARMEQLIGCPVLLNTSLNNSSGPIISSIDQAKRFFRNSNLEVLCVGNEVLEK